MADSLISLHSYGYNNFLPAPNMLSRPSNHNRSQSAGKRSRSPARYLTKMKSTTVLSEFSMNGRRLSPAGLENLNESDFNTIRDPRIATRTDLSGTPNSSHHPDLNSEVATLSAKLVQAINNQTNLDDSLSATRQELEAAKERLLQLESENVQFRADLSSGVMVRRSDVESEVIILKNTLNEERSRRSIAEKDKKEMEQELETLTAALFEEANKMVAVAKQEREAVEKKNEQLRAQIKDTEALVAFQEEQLAELKAVMQEMHSTRDENDSTPNSSTAPASPAAALQGNLGRFLDNATSSPVTPNLNDMTPVSSTSLSHLIKPIYRTDMPAYEDFRELLEFAKTSKPSSRVGSGSYGGLNVMGLAGLTSSNSSNVAASGNPSNNQSHTPAGSPQTIVPHAPLKDTKFYKRILVEDFEPTLRLDAAPSISWLSRRSVLSSLCDGSLIVEPLPASLRKYQFPCGLCGERRTGDVNERTHRFRTSESESAQRYSLCVLCLEKVRACCEFAGYLRMILDGHVHVSDVEEEKEAWEETIRLRERIFWSRFGGGVIPIFGALEYLDKPSFVPDQAGNASVVDEPSKCPTDSEDAVAQNSTDVETPESPPVLLERHAGRAASPSEVTDRANPVGEEGEDEAGDKEAGDQLRTDLENILPDLSHSNADSESLPPSTETTIPHMSEHSEIKDDVILDAKAMPGAFD